MNISLEISDDLIQNFSPDALKELKDQSLANTLSLIKDASDLEDKKRKNIGTKEVTQNDVFRAVMLNDIISKKEKKWWQKLLQAITPALSAIPGFIYPLDTTLTDVICLIIFLVVVTLTYILIQD